MSDENNNGWRKSPSGESYTRTVGPFSFLVMRNEGGHPPGKPWSLSGAFESEVFIEGFMYFETAEEAMENDRQYALDTWIMVSRSVAEILSYDNPVWEVTPPAEEIEI